MGAPDTAELAARALRDPAIARLSDALAAVPGCWLVGGAVRDLHMGTAPLDLDVVVEGDAVAAAVDAAGRLGGTARPHERFGTATVEAGELSFDLASARRERYPAPGALPEVEPASLEDDLARRDFTVNALALGVSPEVAGRLRGVPHALEDLDARRLRVLHERSFLDDPTRLLRLVRYGARLGFDVEPGTAALAQAAVEEGALATVSGARIGRELMLALREPAATAALERAAAMGIDGALHPGCRVQLGLARRSLESLPPGGRADLALLASLVTDFEAEELRVWLGALELTAAEREAVVAAALDSPDLAQGLTAAQRPSEVAALARRRPPEQLALAAALGARPAVEAWTRELSRVRLEISGADLIAAGVPEGPRVGRGLEAALDHRLDGGAPGRAEQLRVALEAAGRSGAG